MSPDPPLAGSELYDDEAVFERYFTARRPSDSPVITMETPALWDAVGDVRGLTILELGCGDGQLAAQFLERGSARYLGVDASHRMVTAAGAHLDASRASVVRDDLSGYSAPANTFDLVVSLRVLHYIPDLIGVLTRAASALRPGGRLVYSHEHPVITSFETREPDGRRGSWTVDNYFVSGERDVTFLGRRVLKYHRTVEQHLDAVHRAGLELSRLRECPPVRELFDNDSREYERRLRIPLFLLIEARLPRAA